jgi:transposase
MVHRAGEKLFIDYAGPTIKLTDGTKAHIYVAALGASSYTFAYATPRRKLPQTENNMKIEASISLRRRDEEVKVHGEPDCCNIG